MLLESLPYNQFSEKREIHTRLSSAACVGEEGHPLAVQSALPRRNILYRR